MGASASASQEKKRSKKIDRNLSKQHNMELKKVKMLLLGCGECGKSTLVKQMQLIHANGFDKSSRELRKPIIHSNIVTGMATLIAAVHNFDLPYDHTDRMLDAERVTTAVSDYSDNHSINESLKSAIQNLWADSAIFQAFRRRNEFQFDDSTQHFFNDLDRICVADWIPTDQDMLLSRVATNGVVEVQFEVNKLQFRVFDVGGQRSQRRKWVHCFDNVQALIFVSAVSEFDQVLVEDGVTNRLVESVRLYASIVGSRYFTDASVLLFLNKKDLFEEKLKNDHSIVHAFPDYSGTTEYAESMEFIKLKFEEKNPAGKEIYVHETCATDCNQVQLVLDSVITSMINKQVVGNTF